MNKEKDPCAKCDFKGADKRNQPQCIDCRAARRRRREGKNA